ncbi:uncharacterized protein L969DRAFT_85312 [Mixia osmundae IAM 14324]|uniref:DNA replication complex GINS protein SLD5 n=1 Tax=Mixia osmundae (strain CBS 9802 / IAM 14324 / JCM 22182 / KY 12970) TaxID=764103 RepID=G7DYF9_MIXOS|nr:uncharacterized protein L969DRAFT_85312 [Mixia osmundae IAM 14324]KEI41521.1 hypothetical protein L969DRAFT_85312 [Mixia osmundae IAM 14324]GAA95619.1 hypothetical protein E5Q_02275 [Mixia osmundae IAM 14324]
MPGFFDDDDDDEQSPIVQPPPPVPRRSPPRQNGGAIAGPGPRSLAAAAAAQKPLPNELATSRGFFDDDEEQTSNGRTEASPAGTRHVPNGKAAARHRTESEATQLPLDVSEGYQASRETSRVTRDTKRQRMRSRDEIAGGAFDLDLDLTFAEEDALLLDDTQTNESQIETLRRHWQNERMAPEVLPHQEDLVDSLLEQIEQQTDAVNLLKDGDSTSEELHFQLMLVQTDMERVKWLLQSYLRTRMDKIERFAQYLLADAEAKAKLTSLESEYLTRYQRMVDKLMVNSFVKGLPERLQALDTEEMVELPDMRSGIICMVRRACGPIQLPSGEELDLEPESIHLLQYHAIRPLLLRGDIRLV